METTKLHQDTFSNTTNFITWTTVHVLILAL